MTRALITGIAGFAARHLAERLLALGHDVYGTVRPGGRVPDIAGLPPERLCSADIGDDAAIAAAVRAARPSAVFHLAGVTFVPQSHTDPTAAYRVNVLGTVTLLAAVHAGARDCRVVFVGSGEAYGRVETAQLPIDETCPWRPLTPYGASKAAADLVAYQWSQAYGLDIVRLRPFNHTGPGQRPAFVCADFARQLVAIERGLRSPELRVGNLDAVRDFIDVRDIVEAYVTACEHAAGGEAYNLCSGVGRSIRSVLDDLIGLSGVHATIVVDPAKRRPVEVPCLVGSAAKFHAATGWRPAIPWRQTLQDLLADWRGRPDAQLS